MRAVFSGEWFFLQPRSLQRRAGSAAAQEGISVAKTVNGYNAPLLAHFYTCRRRAVHRRVHE
jgi:hypothetical protein